ncbi:MAG: patatin family protein [Fibromonadaceae bacterium]|jgi:predicted patatin/cPLA2 family phospholipase|nr:patatin family protein [Fibromonadaceae bacterium]
MKLHYGLVLEGGGLRGLYTSGVIDLFLEKEIEFPFVIGVSAGAGYGCSFVSKQYGRNLRVMREFRKDPRYLSLKSYIKTGNYFGLDFIYDEIPKHIPFDTKAFLESQTRFITVCSNVETGEAEYFDKEEDILQALKASSAVPFMSRIIEYKGKKLLDGGITDAIPLKKSIELGFSKNVVILTHPEGFRRKNRFHPSWFFYRKYPKFIKAINSYVARYNESLEFVEEEAKKGNVLLIRPSENLKVKRTESDISKLERLYELGKKDAAAFSIFQNDVPHC